MLKTESVVFSYDNNEIFSFPDLKIDNGEHLLILGKSGVGKSTFIQILAGLLNPKSGNVELNGTEFGKLSSNKLDRFRGENVGLIFQKPHFIKSLSLEENLKMSLFLARKNQNVSKITSLLKQVGLSHKKDQNPLSLSQGEQQRASIVMSLIKEPNLILADEPTASLDDNNCMETSKMLQEYCSEKNSKLIIVTHDNRLKDEFKNSISL